MIKHAVAQCANCSYRISAGYTVDDTDEQERAIQFVNQQLALHLSKDVCTTPRDKRPSRNQEERPL